MMILEESFRLVLEATLLVGAGQLPSITSVCLRMAFDFLSQLLLQNSYVTWGVVAFPDGRRVGVGCYLVVYLAHIL